MLCVFLGCKSSNHKDPHKILMCFHCFNLDFATIQVISIKMEDAQIDGLKYHLGLWIEFFLHPMSRDVYAT